MVSKTVEIVVEMAFQMVSNVVRIPSKIGVKNATIAFQMALIFSEIQSITLPTMIWMASKIV